MQPRGLTVKEQGTSKEKEKGEAGKTQSRMHQSQEAGAAQQPEQTWCRHVPRCKAMPRKAHKEIRREGRHRSHSVIARKPSPGIAGVRRGLGTWHPCTTSH